MSSANRTTNRADSFQWQLDDPHYFPLLGHVRGLLSITLPAVLALKPHSYRVGRTEAAGKARAFRDALRFCKYALIPEAAICIACSLYF
jgi:hypothetical protein